MLTLVDTLELQPLYTIKAAFLTKNEKTMTLRSNKTNNQAHQFTLRICWTTPEYQQHVEGLERNKAIDTIKH